MKALITTSPPTVFNRLPEFWIDIATGEKIQNFHKATESVIYDNGFRDVVQPSFNTETHKRDNTPFYDDVNDWVTYNVIALTDEELKNRVFSQARGARETAIQNRIRKQIEEQFHAIIDDQEALNNQEAYPFWEAGIPVLVDEKYQAFEGNVLKLYKVQQDHITQEDWHPTLVPSLFVKVLPPSEGVPLWEAGIEVLVDEEYEYDSVIYTVLQSHTTQEGWEPPNVPSLFEVKQ